MFPSGPKQYVTRCNWRPLTGGRKQRNPSSGAGFSMCRLCNRSAESEGPGEQWQSFLNVIFHFIAQSSAYCTSQGLECYTHCGDNDETDRHTSTTPLDRGYGREPD